MKYALGRSVTSTESLCHPDEEFVFLEKGGHWKPRITNARLFDTEAEANSEKKYQEELAVAVEDDCVELDDYDSEPMPTIKVVRVLPDWETE
jgi:hypothetical protein